MADDQDVKIAVLEERMDGLREQHKAQALETRENFKEVFTQLTSINANISRSMGFFSASRWFTGAIGGLFAVIIEAFFGAHK